jgi:hypothetical protein
LVNLCLGLAGNNAVSVPVSRAVLPGPEQAGLPFQQKYTAIWQKHTANSCFFKKIAIFPLNNVIFRILTSKTYTEFFSNFNSYHVCLSKYLRNKIPLLFRYFSATFA